MQVRQATYVHDGDTFVGSFEITMQQGAEVVTVHHRQREASAQLGHDDPARLASILLGQLVREALQHEQAVLAARRRITLVA